MSNSNSNFDVNAFLQETIAAPLDTQRLVVPAGEYLAQIDTGEGAIGLNFGTVKKEGSKMFGKPWASLNVKLVIPDPNLAAQLKTDRVVVYGSIMLDLNDAGKVDQSPQRNIRLGKLLDACGQNVPGGSIAGCAGKTVKVMIGVDQEEGRDPRNEVISFAKPL